MVKLQRADPPPARGRDAGLGHLHLLRQDRHADAEPHARRAVCWPAENIWKPGDPAPGLLHLELLRAAALCNDASHTLNDGWQGDPTETALTQVARRRWPGQADARAGGAARAGIAVRRRAQAHDHLSPHGRRAGRLHQGRAGGGAGAVHVAWQPGGASRSAARGRADSTPKPWPPQGLRVLALALAQLRGAAGTRATSRRWRATCACSAWSA